MEELDARLAVLRARVQAQARLHKGLVARNRETTQHAQRSVAKTRAARGEVDALTREGRPDGTSGRPAD